MKIKCMLPIENRGLTVHNIDPSWSFYQLFEKDLQELEIKNYVLSDSYGRIYSISQPLNQINAYPGISFELKKMQNIEKGLVKTLGSQKLKIKIDIYQKSSIQLEVYPNDIVKNKLDELKIDNGNMEIIFQGKHFSLQNTFSGIGCLNLCKLSLKEIQQQVDETEEGQSEDNQQVSTQPQKIKSNELTQQDMQIFAQERQAWQVSHGIGESLPPETRRQLYEERAKQKQILKIKIVQNSLTPLSVIELGTLSTCFDLLMKVRTVMAQKCLDLPEEQTVEILQELVVRKGINGPEISQSKLELFEFFNEGNGIVQIVSEFDFDPQTSPITIEESADDKFGKSGRKL